MSGTTTQAAAHAIAAPETGETEEVRDGLALQGIVSNTAVAIQSGLCVLFGVALLTASAVGLWKFNQAGYFHDLQYPTNWIGYDVPQFVGLVFFTFCTTPGVLLIFNGSRSLARTRSDESGSVLLFLFPFLLPVFSAIGITVGTYFLVFWGGSTMRCLGAFCLDMTTYPHLNQSNAGFGWLAIVGIAMGFSLIPLGAIGVFASVTQAVGGRRGRDVDADNGTGGGGALDKLLSTGSGAGRGSVQYDAVGDTDATNTSLRAHPLPDPPLLIPPKLAAASPHRNRTRLLTIAVAILVLLVFMFVTFYIPNSWEYFVASRIAKNAMLQMSMNYTLCANDYASYACPEYPWAVFTTANWQVSSVLIAKIYPSNVFFFGYLIAVLLLTAALVFTDGVQHPLKSVRLICELNFKLKSRRMPFRGSWSYKDGLMTAMAIIAASLFLFYWLHDHNFNGLGTGGTDNTLENRGLADSEHWARSLGQLASFFLGLLFFPASRWSVMHHACGTSWEGLLWAHRVLGYAMLAATIGHMIAWWYRMHELGLFPRDILQVPMTLSESVDNFTVPLVTLGTFTIILCMGVLALNPVRRRFFEIFYYSHLFAAYSIIPIVLWHAAAGWEYLLPGVTVWFIDRCIRYARSSRTVELRGLAPLTELVTQVHFVQRGLRVSAGQYVFVNIPRLGLFEWHPFTVVSGNEDEGYTLIIRSQGEGQWTHKLFHLAQAAQRQRQGTQSLNGFVGDMHVDGPCGHVIDFAQYSRVRLLCCGIGITPGAAIISAIGETHPDATLTWSVREKELATAMLPYISNFSASTHVYVTSAKRDTDIAPLVTKRRSPRDDTVTFHAGRPSVDQCVGDTNSGSTLVFVCGPEEAISSWEEQLSVKDNVVFHRETFLL